MNTTSLKINRSIKSNTTPRNKESATGKSVTELSRYVAHLPGHNGDETQFKRNFGKLLEKVADLPFKIEFHDDAHRRISIGNDYMTVAYSTFKSCSADEATAKVKVIPYLRRLATFWDAVHGNCERNGLPLSNVYYDATAATPFAVKKYLTGVYEDLSNQVYVDEEQIELRGRDFVERLASVVTFTARKRLSPVRKYAVLIYPDMKTRRVNMAGTPSYLLDSEELGFVYLSVKGDVDKRCPFYFVPYTPNKSLWSYHMRNARRSYASRRWHTYHSDGARSCSVPAKEGYTAQSVYAALMGDVSDKALQALFEELGVEYDGAIEAQGGVLSHVAIGGRATRNANRILENLVGPTSAVSDATAALVSSFRQPVKAAASIGKKLMGLLSSGDFMARLYGSCFLLGIMYMVVSTAAKAGFNLTSKASNAVLSALRGSLPGQYALQAQLLQDLQAPGVISAQGDGINTSRAIATLLAFSAARRGGRRGRESAGIASLLNPIALASVASEAATAYDKTMRSAGTIDSMMRGSVKIVEVVTNKLLSLVTDKRVQLTRRESDVLTMHVDNVTELHPLYVAGQLPLHEPQRGANITTVVKAIAYFDSMLVSGSTLTPGCVAEIRHVRSMADNIARAYRADGATTHEERPHPIVIMMAGAPGIGKSLITPAMVRAVLSEGIQDEATRNRLMSLSNAELIYQKSSSEFWDGEAGHAVYGFDDWMAEVQQPGKETDASLLLHVANVWPMPLNMANVDMKGRKYARPYIVACTTNMQKLADVESNIRHQDALKRRLDFCFELSIAAPYNDPQSEHYMMRYSGGIQVLDVDKYQRLVKHCSDTGEKYPWYVHTARMIEYRTEGIWKGVNKPLEAVLAEAATKLQQNLRIHSSGTVSVDPSCLRLDMSLAHPDIIQAQGGTSYDDVDSFSRTAGRLGLYSKEFCAGQASVYGFGTAHGADSLAAVSTDPAIRREHLKTRSPVHVKRTLRLLRQQEVDGLREARVLEVIDGRLRGEVIGQAYIHDVLLGTNEGDGSLVDSFINDITEQHGTVYNTMASDQYTAFRAAATHDVSPLGLLGSFGVEPVEMRFARVPRFQRLSAWTKEVFGFSPVELGVFILSLKLMMPIIKGVVKQVFKLLKTTFGVAVTPVRSLLRITNAHGTRRSNMVVEALDSQRNYEVTKLAADAMSVATRNIVDVYHRYGGEERCVGHGFRVAGRSMLTLAHIFDAGPDVDVLLRSPQAAGTVQAVDVVLPYAVRVAAPRVAHRESPDLIMVHIASLPCESRKIFGFFPEQAAVRAFAGGTTSLVDYAGEQSRIRVVSSVSKRQDFTTEGPNGKYVYRNGYRMTGIKTAGGDCGLPYVGDHGTASIYAIHVGGTPSSYTSAAQGIVREELVAMYDGLSQSIPAPVSDGLPILAQGSWVPGHGFVSLAQVPPLEGVSTCPVSALRKSRVHDLVPPILGCEPGTHKPARLHSFRNDLGDEVFPMERAIARYGGSSHVFPHDRVLRAASVAVAPMSAVGKLRVLSFEDAVAGIPGLYKGIPRDKSHGFPKQKFTRKQAFGWDDYTFDTAGAIELRDDVLHYVQQLNSGCRPLVVYADFPKDELLKREKVDKGDTRLISSSPTFFYIAFRMLFGELMMAYEKPKQRLRNGVAIGVNPYVDWADMYHHLQHYGDRGFAGDFEKFDARQQRQVLEAVWLRLCSFYDDEYNVARRLMGLELTDSVHLGKSGNAPSVHLYGWRQSMPSGHPATALVNSLYNITLFVLCYADLTGKPMELFWDDIRIVTLGDDNVVVPRTPLLPVFNLATVAQCMASYGMVYTNADKTSELVPHTELDACTFLKRGFRVFPGGVDAPVAKQSLAKMCAYWRVTAKSGLSEAEAMRNNLDTLLRELSLWGQDEFDATVPHLVQLFRDTYDIGSRVYPDYHIVRSTLSDSAPHWMAAFVQLSKGLS